jgi:uncharacterized protein involved in outer membrane biogenesis
MNRNLFVKPLLAALALLLLLPVASLALLDWGLLTGPLERRAGAALGRPVEIGAVDLRLLPRPMLVLEGVRIARSEATAAPALLDGDSLTLVPDLNALLHGRLVAASAHLDGPRLALTPGDELWRRPQPAEGTDAAAGMPAAGVLERIERLRLSDARLQWRTPDSAPPVELRVPALSIDREGQAWRLDGRAAYQDLPTIGFTGRLANRASSWSLSGFEATAVGGIVLDGRLELTADRALRGEGRLKVQALELQRLVDLVGGAAHRRFGAAALDGRLDGGIGFVLEPLPITGIGAAAALDRLQLGDGELHYRSPTADTDLRLRPKRSAAQGADERLRVALDGQLRGHPLHGSLTLDPPAELFDAADDYRLALRLRARGLEAQADTTLARLRTGDGPSLNARLAFEDADDLATWLPVGLPTLPAGRLAGTLSVADGAWRLNGLKAQLGGSRLHGSLRIVPGERPHLTADLEAPQLDLGELAGGLDGGEDARGPDLQRLLGVVDAELELDAATVRLPESPPLERLRLVASLHERLVEVGRLDFAVRGGEVTAQASLDGRRRPLAGSVQVDFDGLSIPPRWRPPALRQGEFGRLSGRIVLEAAERPVTLPDQNLLLPSLGRLQLAARARLSTADAATTVDIELRSEDPAEGTRRTLASASGQWRGEHLEASFAGDRLLNVRDRTTPYALRLDLRFADSRIRLTGSVTRPLAMTGLDLDVLLEGSNPQRLYRLFGVPLPSLPPYRLAGRLALKDARWTLEGLSGWVGDSDLSGRLSLDLGAATPMLRADLRSQSLDFDDLGGLVGLPAAAAADNGGAQPAYGGGGADEDVSKNEAEVLPETRFAFERLRGAAAQLHYRAEEVDAGGLPLDRLEVELRLDDGQMAFEPLDFGIGDGKVRSRLDIDAREAVLKGVLETEVRGVNLRRALRRLPLADESQGRVGGQGKLWLRGRSTAELLSSADGGLNLLMTGGSLDAGLVERAGLDLGETVLAELFDRPAVPIDCAYADLQFRAGRMQLAQAVIDSADTLFELEGSVDFNAEDLNIVIHPYPKDVSLPTARSPLRIQGPFADARLSIGGTGLVTRTLAALGLGAIAGPVAALLPLVETGGGGESVYCEGLVGQLDQAQRAGASQ